ncbi:histone acetyltransferase HPA2 [Stutzerimonas nosocomialis]|uniref:DUF7931 domain-containing protein n=1 Tax=Stutzerimonas nosocomialis TaxID=1056496 RepID=UPI001109B927|nr:histone acetyltransferase HPA2 [Stutzerimonas nosocomialis]TLX56131.1 histone acetyltransferase HPA2 [Stutzerimonas nosocomialis]
MSEYVPEDTEPLDELPAIEFESPGRFAINNPAPDVPEPERWEPAPFVLGTTEALQRFTLPEQIRPHALAMLQQARRSLCLYTPDLEPWLYHHSSIQQACSQFLLAHPRNRLRILVGDSSRAVKDGHRLLNLARRLTSNLHIRKINPDYPASDPAFLLADTSGLILRPELDSYGGYALYRDPGRVRLRQAEFDRAWDSSLSDPDLRSFLL